MAEKYHVDKIRSGQVAAYKDSIYEFEVTSKEPEQAVEEHCKTEVYPCSQKSQGSDFSGSCSFPFGLNSYYKFKKIDEDKYKYIVCSPYTG